MTIFFFGGGAGGEMMGVSYDRKATDENRNPAQNLVILFELRQKV